MAEFHLQKDGKHYKVNAETKEEAIQKVMNATRPQEADPNREGVIGNIGKGLARGLTGIAGIQGDVGNLVEMGARALPGRAGEIAGDIVSKTPLGIFPSSDELRRGQPLAGASSLIPGAEKLDVIPDAAEQAIFRGGEETLSGRVGEFVGGNLPFVAGGLIKTGVDAGARAVANQAIKIAAANTAAATGSKVGEELFGTTGAIAGALTPAALTLGAQGVTRVALRGFGKEMQQRMQQNIRAIRQEGGVATLGAVSPREKIAALEASLESVPGVHGAFLRAAAKNSSGFRDRLLKIIADDRKFSDWGGGIILESGLKTRYDALKRQIRVKYDKADEALTPAIRQQKVPIGAFRNRIAELSEEGGDELTRAIVQSIKAEDDVAAKVLENLIFRNEAGEIVGRVGRMRIDQLDIIRRAIGRQLNIPGLMGDQRIGTLKQMYTEVADAMEAGIKQVASPRVYNQWRDANKFFAKSRLEMDKLIAPMLRQALQPEALYRTALTTTLRNKTKLQTALKGLGTKDKDHLAKAFVAGLGRIDDTGQSLTAQEFHPGRFLSNWTKIDDEAKAILFSSPSGQALKKSLDRYAKAVLMQKHAAGSLANPSGTAGRGLGAAFLASAMMATGQIATLGALGGGMAAGLSTLGLLSFTMAGSGVLARNFTNPRFVDWLAKGMTISDTQWPTHLARLRAIAERETDPDMLESLDAFNTAMFESIKATRPKE